MDDSRSKKPPYRRIRSTDATEALINSRLLAPGHCGIVDYIEFVVQPYHDDVSSGVRAFIPGGVVMPYGQYGEKSFFADIAVTGSSGYFPLQKNIADPVYFRISLIADDGNYHIITQRIPPQFKVRDTVRLNRGGSLESAECVMQDPGKIAK